MIRAVDAGPVVVEIPHAGLAIDERAAAFTRIPERALRAGAIEEDADFGADLVWEGTENARVTRVVARASRYVIDLNTNPRPPPRPPFYEVDPEPQKIFHRSQCGVSWVEEGLPRSERERRITEVLEPYHAAVELELERARALHGAVCLVSAHTFQDRKRAISDLVLGTQREQTAPASLRDAVADVARARGFSVALEQPFQGGWSLTRHARPSTGVMGLQIEMARRLVTGPDDRRRAVDALALSQLRELALAIVGALVASCARP
ncbi:MAG: N-formylglutamate amidohydrolase [Polyangiaceae bacterium]